MNRIHHLLFFIPILFALAGSPVHAQGGEPPIPAAPPEGSYVLDELEWLTSDQEDTINSIVRGLDRDGIAEIAVVTLNDCGSDKLAFRKSLFNNWGIGHANDSDGLLILVCWYDGYQSRRSVEQIYGPGLNGILTSSRTDQVAQEDFVPAFHASRPGDGLLAMVREYHVILRTGAKPGSSTNPVLQYFKGLDEGTIFTGGMLLAAAVLLVLNKYLPRSIQRKGLERP